MNIQPNAYELNKIYRQEQEARSERERQAKACQETSEKSSKPSILALVLSVLK
jgi:hypothetical protein